MTPKNFPLKEEEDHHHHPLLLSPAFFDYQSSSSSASASASSSASDHHHNHITNENIGLKFTIWKKEHSEEDTSPKWMSSKMRLMNKMMMIHNSPTIQFSSSSTENTTIRVCADCNTTKTPLWRSGPRGPKSLCNACGIRQRKARRAAAAAGGGDAAAAPVVVRKKSNNKVQLKQKDKAANSCLPFKKRCKMTSPTPPKKKNNKQQLNFDELCNKTTSSYQRVFPQDEKEAAVLLMALSYGLVHG